MNWRRIISGCAFLAWLAVLPSSGPANSLTTQGGALMQELLRDPLTILTDRSPGGRESRALITSKPQLAAGPTERVLSPVLERPVNAIPANLDNLPDRAMEVIYPTLAAIPAASTASPVAPPLPIPGLPDLPGSLNGTIPPDAGGDGGGITPPVPPPAPPPPVVTPVPEPATWVMMIAGIALIGWQLRRRQTGLPGLSKRR